MPTNTYDLGDLVRVYTSSAFTDADSGDAIDPDVVNFSIRQPDGTVTTYMYGTDDEVIRDGTGNYHMDVDANASGTWFHRIWSTGDGQAAEEQRFFVRDAQAVEDDE